MRSDIKHWIEQRRTDLRQQLAAFDPPLYMRTNTNGADTTEESKARVLTYLAQLEELECMAG